MSIGVRVARRAVLSAGLVVSAGLGLVVGGDARAADDYRWAVPEWRATWSAPRFADDRGFAVEATDDAVFVAGVTGSHTTGAGDLFLLRYDLDGNLQWSRTWGGFELDQAQDLAVDGDRVWVVGSGTTDDARAEIYSVVLGFDTDGDQVAERTFQSGALSVLQAVVPHGDAVYVAGLTHPTRADRDLFAARLDATDLSTVWEHRHGDSGWDEAWDLAVDDTGVYVGGYTTLDGETTSDALLLVLDHDGAVVTETVWGGEANDELRALTFDGPDLVVTGGAQTGRSTDVFVARLDRDGTRQWQRNTGGQVTGGGGYGVAVGEEGIYVAGGSYDFPAGGDAAILRFSHDGDLQWSQVLGYPGFWDWGFDVDVRDGRFYVAGVLWRAGAEWYEVLTLAYDESLPMTSLSEVAAQAAAGDAAGAAKKMESFFVGDFLRWAQEQEPGSVAVTTGDPADDQSYAYWEGASDQGRRHGVIWVDTDREEPVGHRDAPEAFAGLAADAASGNYALVRDYTGVRVSLLGGTVRARYYISHDRLIPQGGYLYVGDTGIAIPPPPV